MFDQRELSLAQLAQSIELERENGLETIAIVGGKRGPMANMVDHVIVLDDLHYGRVVDAQMTILHMLCYVFTEVEKVTELADQYREGFQLEGQWGRFFLLQAMRKAIVIPSHRAEATLPDVLAALPQELLAGKHLVILVNDASPDATGEVADRLAREHETVFALHHESNRGYGGALKTGMRFGLKQGAEVFAVVHADCQYAPEMVLQLCEPIERGITEIVQGSRMMHGGARRGAHPMPWSRYVPNRVLTLFENLVVGTNLAEFHSGYMVYSKKLLEQVPFEAIGENYNFDAEMIILAHMIGIRTVEIPIPTRYDEATSSLAPIPYGLNVLRMMWRVMTGHYLELLDQHGLVKRDLGGCERGR